MNRKERRAARKQGEASPAPAMQLAGRGIQELVAAVRENFRKGRPELAEEICQHILAREPKQIDALNFLGLIAQASGEHTRAVKHFARALEAEGASAVHHYNMGVSYQALRRSDKAAAHFTRAIALGMNADAVEKFVTHAPAVAGCLRRIAQAWPRPLTANELLGGTGVGALADETLLHCMLKTLGTCDWLLERLLTQLRFFLLQAMTQPPGESANVDEGALRLYAALAQQCFITEYMFAQSDDETTKAAGLRDLLNDRLAAGGDISALLAVTVACYFPLHTLPMAERLRDWPEPLGDLLRQQVREPLEERRDRAAIPAITAVDDSVSLQVRQQYEENPYPRWTVIPPAMPHPDAPGTAEDVLVAGCGTGKHSAIVALMSPQARILAIDISAASLAYARRKAREAGLHNIEFAQADILKLGAIGRSFDRIETIGVLHHLADPKAGWRVLLSLLKAGGVMHVGLYSETARQSVVACRTLIAQRGFPATPEGIRAFRQEILRMPDSAPEKYVTTLRDFYSTSGCRDLLFNVMEHRFTLPDIKAFLAEQKLTFLGFDVTPEVEAAFRRRFPAPGALTDFDCWQAFEADNPETFLGMYRFRLRKNASP